MLRPRPSVISLTRADVTDVVHRRRFRRYLEFEEGDACVDFGPVETDTTCKLERHATPRSGTAQRKTTPTTYDSTQNSSPIMSGGVHHWVKDVPLLLLSDKEVDEDVSPPPEVSGSQVRRSRTRGKPQQGPEWTLQLCLRPKPNLLVATTPVVDDEPTGSQDSRENPTGGSLDETEQSGDTAIRKPGPSLSCLSNVDSSSMRGGETNQATSTHRAHLSRDSTDVRLKSGAGPSTPRRGLPSGSPGSPPTTPIVSSRVSRRSFDASDARQDDRSSSEISSPSPTLMSPGRLRIYNDFLPASSQPQTPRNLPEARRQSRRQGSYTAPARRASPQPALTTTTIRPRRVWRRRREPSPLGLRTPGLAGLSGGTENIADPALFDEVAGEMAQSRASPSRPSDSVEPI